MHLGLNALSNIKILKGIYSNYLFAGENCGRLLRRLFGKLEKGDAAVVKSVTFRNEFEGKRLNFSTLSDT